jgi:curli biogenesis system outer membrane secretion channel CsgG
MTPRTLTALLTLFSFVTFGQAPPKSPAPAKKAAAKNAAVKPLDQIKKMVQMKLPDQAIVNQINSFGPALAATPDDLIALRQLGASDAVIVAFSGGGSAAPSSAAPVASSAAAAAGPNWNSDLSAIPCAPASSSAKRILAIDEFDYGTVMTSAQAIFGTNVDLGKGIQALLMKRIAESGQYRVVERRNLSKLMAEQDLGASNRARQAPNARIGRIIGADAILMGTITIFGRDDKRKGVDLGGYAPRVLGRTRVGVGEGTAVVAVSYRLVDAETSEVIDQGEARGESKRKSTSLAISGAGSRGGGFGSTDLTSTNFAATIVGEATTECIDKVAESANAQASSVAPRTLEVEARIADVSGDRIYLAAGEVNGVSKCDRFEVYRVRREILDPTTKEVIDLDLERVGQLLITEVRERVAIGAYNGVAPPEPKMLAKKVLR